MPIILQRINDMNIIAQIFGITALIIYCISLQSNNKQKLLLFLILANIFYGLQYLMLNAYSGLYCCIIGVIRSMIFMKHEKENKDVSILALVIVLFLLIYSAILSYNGLLSLIPILTTFIYSIGVWQKNMNTFRKISILVSITWLFYNFIVGAYAGALSSVIEIIAAIVAINKNKKAVKMM